MNTNLHNAQSKSVTRNGGKTRDIFKEVTDKIIASLKAGTVPWRTPWQTVGSGIFPVNAVTDRRYSGINVLMLWMYADECDFVTNRWLTYNQAKQAGGHVRKGEPSFLACAFRPYDNVKTDEDGYVMLDEDGNEMIEQRYFASSVPIFNIEQCENLPEEVTLMPDFPELSEEERHFNIETLVVASGIQLHHRKQNSAHYSPSSDRISLPLTGQFNSGANYYATLLHELVHSTGHKKRLARESLINYSVSKDYRAFEELIAELGAAFLCAEFGVQGEIHHDSYIDSWLDILNKDTTFIFKAARHAREAFEYLMNMYQKQYRLAA